MAETTFFLAPTPKWQARDLTGKPLIFGKVYTYVNQTLIPKVTYSDPAGQNANTNPIILDAAGQADIYWADDELYTIILKDQNDNTIDTQDFYPTVATANHPDNVTIEAIVNMVRNAQFTYWSNVQVSATINPDINPAYPGYTHSQNNYDFVADDWLFANDSTNGTISLSWQPFPLGQTIVDGNPELYFRYNCTVPSTDGTFKYLYQRYESVNTLSGQEVTLSFWARGTNNLNLSVDLVQFFGTSGPAPIPNHVIANTQLESGWTQYSNTITLSNVSGGVGPNNDDALELRFNFETNSPGQIDLASVLMRVGNKSLSFPYLTVDDQNKNLNSQVAYATFKTGDVKLSVRNLANQPDPGWLYMNDLTIGDPLSNADTAAYYTKALYEIIWNNIHSTIWAPIFTSAGVVTIYGTTAEEDYNLHKRLSLTKVLGRVLGGAGQSVITKIFTADSGTDQLLIDNTSSFYTGTPVSVANSGGALPSPLAPATTYYVINIDGTHIQLATSIANAIAGTAINLTTNGSGTNSIFITETAVVPGQYLGEPAHLQLGGEVGVHGHSASGSLPVFAIGATAGVVGSGSVTPEGNASVTVTVNNSSTNSAMNIMQPTSFFNVMIKL